MRAEPGGAEPSDAELWARARRSDPTPFGLLFERHVDRIFWHCRRQVDSRNEAEDLTSVVFLEAWRRRHEVVFGEHDSVLPWLLAVANNVLRNRRRTVRRHRSLLAKLPALPPDQPNEDVAEPAAVERDDRHVLAAFRQLRPSEQDVLALCVWHNLSPEDAALALGLPTATVQSRLARARTRLREVADREKARRGPDGRRLPSTRGSSPQNA